MRKMIQPNLVTFPENILESVKKSKRLSMDPLLLPWQHFLERALRKDRVIQNSNDVSVTSFLNKSQHNFVILLEILSCTFMPNLSIIRLFIWVYFFVYKLYTHNVETSFSQNYL